ncbi:RAMP superfamily CRISPR-associated protein [Baaleninema simplex]|uniref:RAMP superfamily CRISPR-associated protein n=1 Tax=Baaleninema simplex TaxID=2862350 RepID=UPI0003450182|nr:RAMP superfamily CRISPR-associated protein [Baaleninema simplex]
MKAITFSLKTIQPVLATSFQGDPNSDVSYPYIPGSMIRGVIISRYLKDSRDYLDIVSDEKARCLFFNGTTCYLNAYLKSQEGHRTAPTLLSWRKQKGEEIKTDDESILFYDFSVKKPSSNSVQYQSSDEFWVEEQGYVRQYTVDRRINIHNQRDRRKGRATKTEGEIFCYDAIDAGQTFQGVILCHEADEQLVQLIQDLLQSPDAWLGGSRSAGYGHTKIGDVKPEDSWSEVESHVEQRAKSDIIKITLLSDLILRDKWGHYAAIPPTQLLSEKLGIKLDKPKVAYTDSVVIGGFNRKWGLPLPQVPAVKAGSVFVYENVGITPEQIRQLEAEGIGERRVEGFGRIAVNWRLKEREFPVKKTNRQKLSKRKQPQLQKRESEILARQMADRILRQKLEQLLLEQVEIHQLEVNRITNSQLSRLIVVTRQALDENSYKPLKDLLKQLPSKACEQYKRSKLHQKIDEILKGDWLEERVEPVEIAGKEVTLTDDLKREYSLRLIMAIAKNAMKEKVDE